MSGFELLGQIVAGWLFADLVGGIAHWWEDCAAEMGWPVVGRLLIVPNRLHHDDPMAFTLPGFLARNSTTWAAAAIASALLFLATGPTPFWAAATIGGMMANQVHYWAHVGPGKRPAPVKVLQAMGVLQSSAHHAGHHAPPSDRRYCVLTDLLNPVLDAIHFWSAIERALARIGLPVNGGTR